MKWKEFWPYAHNTWGWTVACITAIAWVYYGPKKMLETYDWYMQRFKDYEVEDYLRSQKTPEKITGIGLFPAKPMSKTISEISTAIGKTENSVRGSLMRLKRRNRIDRELDKWKAIL